MEKKRTSERHLQAKESGLQSMMGTTHYLGPSPNTCNLEPLIRDQLLESRGKDGTLKRENEVGGIARLGFKLYHEAIAIKTA